MIIKPVISSISIISIEYIDTVAGRDWQRQVALDFSYIVTTSGKQLPTKC